MYGGSMVNTPQLLSDRLKSIITSFINAAKIQIPRGCICMVRLRSAELILHLCVTACYLLCSFSEAAQGAVQHAHSIPDARVPAFHLSLVTEQKTCQTCQSEILILTATEFKPMKKLQ